MQVTAAHADSSHLEKHIVLADDGFFQFSDFDAMRLGGEDGGWYGVAGGWADFTQVPVANDWQPRSGRARSFFGQRLTFGFRSERQSDQTDKEN